MQCCDTILSYDASRFKQPQRSLRWRFAPNGVFLSDSRNIVLQWVRNCVVAMALGGVSAIASVILRFDVKNTRIA